METKNQEHIENIHNLVSDLRFFINTQTDGKRKQPTRLSGCLELLCSQKVHLNIVPIGRKKCLICQRTLKSGELLLKFPCECFYDMHYSCFNENPFTFFRLTPSGYMRCRTCKQKYHISEEYYEKGNYNESFLKSKFEEHKAEVLTCKICATETLTFIKLDCGHKFCQNCLREYIKQNLTANQFSLQNMICPAELCKKPLTFKVIQKILLKEEIDQMDTKILAFNPDDFLKKQEKIIRCPKAECDFFCIIGTKDNLKTHTCPKCNEQFCVNGCPELHPGYSCAQYKKLRSEEGKEFAEVVQKNKIKLCVKCGAWIEKNKGCNHITCKCNHQFCYICGKKWRTCECPQYDDERTDDELHLPVPFGLRNIHNQLRNFHNLFNHVPAEDSITIDSDDSG